MRRWIYKTDEEGGPRRFLSHREAIQWALLTIGKVAGIFVVVATLRTVFDPGSAGQRSYALYLVFVLLMFGLFAAFVLYIYVALLGGVMNQTERQHYHREGFRPGSR